MLLEFPSAVQAQEYKLRSARSSPICGTGVFSLDRSYGQALMPDFDENLPKDSSSGPDVRREWL